jgi:hypothetical protein
MKITIKDIIKENKDIDSKQRFINGIVNIIRLPYFKFLEVNEVPRELWNDIFSKLFKQKVKIYNNVIYDSNNNNIYSENSYGYWEMYKYDENNNEIYFEDSDGYWEKREYDENNNVIYYEDSDGEIMDKRPSNPINENIDPEEKYINGISNMIRTPYFYNLRVNEVPEELWDRILSKLFNTKVTYGNNKIFDSNNNVIYFENSDGYWRKHEFDKNNNPIYYENSDGIIRDNRPSNINENIDPKQRYINGIVNMITPPYFNFLEVNEVPRELWEEIFTKLYNQWVIIDNNVIYDSNNNRIYFEDYDGYWVKREYDSNNNEIYYENSNGDWVKREFDSNNNEIYYENSNGYWEIHKYDNNGNKIYYENSDGEIMDKRPSNPINENIDPKQRYINKVSEILNPPYFRNLGLYDVPRELWNDIFSNIFNRIVTYGNNKMFDSNNNVIYFENSDGNWVKREYDKNNNEIYYEDSNGYWWKQEFDSNNNQIYYENSDGDWVKREFDSNNNQIYYEDSDGYWVKREYDSNNNQIYYENSDGDIMDNRPISSINENNTI